MAESKGIKPKTLAGREPLIQYSFQSSLSKMFACNTCNAVYQSRSDLYMHYESVHQQKLFYCKYCSKPFTRSSSLKTHIRVHTGERPYPCQICGKFFTQLSNVLQHKRDVHIKDKRFKCTTCDKAFSRLETLQCHTRIHTGERLYCCDICGKSFSQRANLKIHTRIHRGEKTRPARAKREPSGDRGVGHFLISMPRQISHSTGALQASSCLKPLVSLPASLPAIPTITPTSLPPNGQHMHHMAIAFKVLFDVMVTLSMIVNNGFLRQFLQER